MKDFHLTKLNMTYNKKRLTYVSSFLFIMLNQLDAGCGDDFLPGAAGGI